MNPQLNRQIILEIIWWAFTLVLTALVLLPIYSKVIPFPFYTYNAVYVIVAITVTRYVFTLKINWMRDRFIIQGAFCFLMIPTIFLMGQGLNEYITYLDNNGPDVMIAHLPLSTAKAMKAYLNSEYFFFGVWAILAGVILPFRVIYRVWTRYKLKRG